MGIAAHQKLDEVRQKYANCLVDRLMNTWSTEEAFAVAINGSWGTGKTTFLQAIKDNLEERKVWIMTFNSWDCRSPKQIIVNFFTKTTPIIKALLLSIRCTSFAVC